MKKKNYVLILITLLPWFMAAAVYTNSIDNRKNSSYPIAAFVFDDITQSSGETAAETTDEPCNLLCERIDVIVSNATNSITVDVSITDENGTELVAFTSLAENTNHVKLASVPDFDAFPAVGTLTASVTPSGDPGASGVTTEIIIYGP